MSVYHPLRNASVSDHLCSLKAPVLWWIWSAALRECGYSVSADRDTGTFEVVKSTKDFVGKSLLKKEYVFRIPYVCGNSDQDMDASTEEGSG